MKLNTKNITTKTICFTFNHGTDIYAVIFTPKEQSKRRNEEWTAIIKKNAEYVTHYEGSKFINKTLAKSLIIQSHL